VSDTEKREQPGRDAEKGKAGKLPEREQDIERRNILGGIFVGGGGRGGGGGKKRETP